MRYESMTNKQLRALLIEAEELNDDQAHRLGKAESTLKAIGEMEQVTTLRIRRLSECNPEFTKAKWVLASSPSTGDKYETLEALLNRSNNDDNS